MNWKKICQALYEFLPAQRRVYFIYTHKNGFDRFKNGLKANTEISYWCYAALKNHFPRVRFLRFQNEKPSAIAQIRPQDVVLGHGGETFLRAAKQTQRLIIFNPWVGHEDHSQEGFNCCPKEIEIEIYQKARSLIWLTSEYNVREYLEKPTNFWFDYYQQIKKEKRVRVVHQPIDLNLFKRIKWEYTTNNFFYIGNEGHMKCLADAREIVRRVERTFVIYGVDGKNFNHLDQAQVAHLPLQADFFIQPGMWEAQCVSILEAAARGFIPLVTPETGYPYDHPFLLKYGDTPYNTQKVKEILNLSAHEKKSLADQLYDRLIQDRNHNHWDQLTKILCEEVQEVLKS